jgi:hypothetical protein
MIVTFYGMRGSMLYTGSRTMLLCRFSEFGKYA